jgi:hypothetical protein
LPVLVRKVLPQNITSSTLKFSTLSRIHSCDITECAIGISTKTQTRQQLIDILVLRKRLLLRPLLQAELLDFVLERLLIERLLVAPLVQEIPEVLLLLPVLLTFQPGQLAQDTLLPCQIRLLALQSELLVEPLVPEECLPLPELLAGESLQGLALLEALGGLGRGFPKLLACQAREGAALLEPELRLIHPLLCPEGAVCHRLARGHLGQARLLAREALESLPPLEGEIRGRTPSLKAEPRLREIEAPELPRHPLGSLNLREPIIERLTRNVTSQATLELVALLVQLALQVSKAGRNHARA